MSEAKEQTKRIVPVAQTTEIAVGGRKFIEIDGRSIAIFNVNGTFVAVLNYCPHAFAQVCMGQVRGTTLPSMPGEYRWGRDGEILACPSHGWEYDLLTGQCLTDKRRIHRYPVSIKGDTIFIKV
jgi:3-phenylpropionate/trans-cinnamate dioxygenase ferredoxin subunit